MRSRSARGAKSFHCNTDGGLSSLYQFAASFSSASSVLLAFLANGLGTRSDQLMVTFCIIVVFTSASALAAFANIVWETRVAG
jgi:hypothetical protein